MAGLPSPRARPGLPSLVGGLALLVGSAALSAELGRRGQPAIYAGLASLVLAVPLVRLSSGALELVVGLGALVVGSVYAHSAGQYTPVEAVGPVPVAEAPGHGSAVALRLDGANVRTDLAVEGARSGRHDAVYVAPLVPEGWGPDAPVPAWAACVGARNHPGSPCLPPAGLVAGGVRLDEATARLGRAAVAEAERARGLRSLAGAPVLVVCDDPSERARSARASALKAWLSLAAAFALVSALARAPAPWAKRAAKADEGEPGPDRRA